MAGKGTVIKVRNNRAVIMTDQCDFKEISLKSPAAAGDTITYSEEDLQHYISYSKIPALVASVLLCCLLVASLLYKPFLGGTYAFISFDINPSFELSVDLDNKVTSARSLNQDGEVMLEQTKITSSPLDRAISQIVKQNCQDGHLDANKTHYIAVSLYFPDDSYDQGFLDYLDALITKELNDNNVAATIFYFKIDKQIYDEALQNNVSPSRWVIWEASQQSGFNYDLNGNPPWSDSRLTDIASGQACRTIRLQARHGMESQAGNPAGDQPGQGQTQYRKSREMNQSGQVQNSQLAPGTGDANGDQNGSNSKTSTEATSSTNTPPYQQQYQGSSNNAPVDSGRQNSNIPSGSGGAAASDGSDQSSSTSGTSSSASSSGTGGSGGSSSSSGSTGSGSGGSTGSGGSSSSGGSSGSTGSGR